MKISVAIATYNGEKYIKEQVQSILNQKLTPHEIIVSDDSDNNKTLEILNNINFGNVNLVYKKNNGKKGYCSNFNNALISASGDFVFLCDQDDYWYSSKISDVISIFKKNKDIDMIINNTLLTDSNLNSIGITKYDQLKNMGFSDDDFLMGCCCTFRKTYLDKVLPIPDVTKGHDNWLNFFSSRLNTKLIIEDVYQLYRRHNSNESKFISNEIEKVKKEDVLKWKVKKILLSLNESTVEDMIFETNEKIKRLNNFPKTKKTISLINELVLKKEDLKFRFSLFSKSKLIRLFLILARLIKLRYNFKHNLLLDLIIIRK